MTPITMTKKSVAFFSVQWQCPTDGPSELAVLDEPQTSKPAQRSQPANVPASQAKKAGTKTSLCILAGWYDYSRLSDSTERAQLARVRPKRPDLYIANFLSLK